MARMLPISAEGFPTQAINEPEVPKKVKSVDARKAPKPEYYDYFESFVQRPLEDVVHGFELPGE